MAPPLSSNFVFDSNTGVGELQCVAFRILDDETVEANETYSVQLRQVPSVVFSESLTTVVIQDDDCKPLYVNNVLLVQCALSIGLFPL